MSTKEKTKEDKKRGVGNAASEAIKAGKDNEEALAVVKKEFPEAKTSLASINWYRNKMRAADKTIPTARELKATGDTKPTTTAAKTKKAKDPLD